MLSFLLLSTLIDPRYKNHGNIFNIHERMQNKVLLQTEVEFAVNPERRTSDYETSVPELTANINDDSPMSSFLLAPQDSNLESEQSFSQNSKIQEEIEAFFRYNDKN
jgi:hypothetical protein